MATNVLLALLLAISAVYNGYVIIRSNAVPESISSTSYFYKETLGKPYLFTLYVLLTVGILFPIWIGRHDNEWQFLVFLSCGGILFTGFTPFFRESFEKPIHYTAGILAVLSCIAWMLLNGLRDILLFEAFLVFICLLYDMKNYVFYIEAVMLSGLAFWLMSV